MRDIAEEKEKEVCTKKTKSSGEIEENGAREIRGGGGGGTKDRSRHN